MPVFPSKPIRKICAKDLRFCKSEANNVDRKSCLEANARMRVECIGEFASLVLSFADVFPRSRTRVLSNKSLRNGTYLFVFTIISCVQHLPSTQYFFKKNLNTSFQLQNFQNSLQFLKQE